MRNIILVTMESLGKSLLDMRWPPILDSIRTNSMQYTKAYAVAPSTHMSLNMLFAGISSSPNNSLEPNSYFIGYRESMSNKGVQFITQDLENIGYNTYAWVSWEPHGIDMTHGFKKWIGRDLGPDAVPDFKSIINSLEEPYFLWVHIFFLHRFFLNQGDPRILSKNRRLELISPLVNQLDHCLLPLIDVNSAVIITSDHGDTLDDGGYGHGFNLTPESTHVPLLVYNNNVGIYDKIVGLTQVYNEIKSIAGLCLLQYTPSPLYLRTFFPLQGGGEIGAVSEDGFVRLILGGDRQSYKDPNYEAETIGWVFYPRYSKELELLGESVLEWQRERARQCKI